MDTPDTRHTWSGELSIAHQVFGNGSTDILYLPAFLSNVVWNWHMPEHARFLSDVRASHDRIVREELDRARGHEVKTMGDGFLATFDGPARAITCASARWPGPGRSSSHRR